LAAAVAVLIQIAAGAQAPALPEGPGAEVVRAHCVSCHDSDLIVSQRLTAAGWTSELAKMGRWGAVVPDPDRDRLVQYLADNFAPRPAASHPRAAEGAAIFTRACLSCHGDELVASQRLSRAAWVREVAKMTGWGAQVSGAERDALADYLATMWGVRPGPR
jgi:mono/diheme cytochrome c family protein